MPSDHFRTRDPPGASPRARRIARKALAPLERFFQVEAASGLLLIAAACVALAWANSPLRESYDAAWHARVGVTFGRIAFERDLHFWINEGLMTIFFFVVGLEIKKEIRGGELSDLKRAALPVAAALGGMVAPAITFAALNHGRASAPAWGVPMATDIAFAVGVLVLLGNRVPPALRILLLALAIIDDVGAILVIAVFYSSSIAWSGLLLFALGLAIILAMQRLGMRNPWSYVPAAAISWFGAYRAGIHPTLAGVAAGLLTPVTAWSPHETESPADRLVGALHGWVAFGVMPLFALANAGVPFGGVSLRGDAARTFAGVVLGLVVGKPIGVVGLPWLCSRVGLVALPRGVHWSHVLVVGTVAGIGFTMALFIAELALPAGPLLEASKIAVLTASGTAAIAGLVAGRVLLR